MKFSMIVAMDKKRGIGKTNDLPWHLPGDMHYFKTTTASTKWEDNPREVKAVIMGRKTWESIPVNVRPLPRRINIVLTNNPSYDMREGVIVAHSLEEAFAALTALERKEGFVLEEVFVIGGGKIFSDAITHPDCKKLYITEIDGVFNCDTFFPEFSKEVFKEISRSAKMEDSGVSYEFAVYQRSV